MTAQSTDVPLANIRNVTIVAHVDHGKTSFADSLLSSNNIISNRMAGKLRFLDSREDEQERGITMESSAVSLRFDMMRTGPDGIASTSKHVCNVIDTPGHVDFASEVSTASRLCDGALVLVDVVEGVCTQTIAVLRQAWMDRLRPVLVINKMDRLITDLKLSPIEAYHHLARLIEQVNAVMGSFYASERMEDDLRWREEREKRLEARQTSQNEVDVHENEDFGQYEEKEDVDLYFAPDRGNVLFASAIDGWAFRLGKFARLYADKLGIKETNLRRVLWGDWFLDPKTKRVVGRKKLAGRALKPMFVQFVLDNVWKVYETILGDYNPDAVQKIVTALSVKISPRDLKSKDTRNLLNIVMQQWLPLSTATFQAIVEVIPAPPEAQAIRLPFMLHPEKAVASATPLPPTNDTERALYSCDQSEASEVIAYVSKMFAMRREDLPEYKPRELTADEMRRRGREEREKRAAILANQIETEGTLPGNVNDGEAIDPSSEVLLGFSRVFSGTIRRNTTFLATLPKYDPTLPPSHLRNIPHVGKVQVTDLYIMMGRDLVAVDSVPAGHVCAIGGLEGKIPRNATLWAPSAKGIVVAEEADQQKIINLAGVILQSAPIVRVALEPDNPADMAKLVRGLKILSQADPCAEYFVQETGEHVILTAGELHLERCLKDLRERFAKCAIQPSAPIVPFRETAVRAPDMSPPKTPGAQRGTIHGSLLNGLVTFTIRAIPLPSSITEFLSLNGTTIGSMIVQHRPHSEDSSDSSDLTTDERTEGSRVLSSSEFWSTLSTLLDEAGPEWQGASDRIWSFGPKRIGANILLDPPGKPTTSRLRSRENHTEAVNEDSEVRAEMRLLRDFEGSVETGFQMASFAGPLCGEPVVGMAWVVESVEYNRDTETDAGKSRASTLVGALISSVRDACRAGMLDWSPRIKLAMYTCDIQASTDVLGKVYAVVARRRGRIVSEEMKEGTSFFTIRAMLPVVESFGFADEIRKRTSGAASPQLIFSGYETLDQDPFWVPSTIEELEDLGEKADRANVAKGYVDSVRKRKGMFVEKKIVESAEKQRTLKR
ncbi:ribosome assembly protein 1 [Tremella mesenterica]|uniref:Ribosome assembly protein 1 n=1 Tax=Tremella mesenterica TaxID=5217 RepID=A0A4Q1BS59_TREME|nr:ribosome assembly protein 1 [Tremella mesenterica]